MRIKSKGKNNDNRKAKKAYTTNRYYLAPILDAGGDCEYNEQFALPLEQYIISAA